MNKIEHFEIQSSKPKHELEFYKAVFNEKIIQEESVANHNIVGLF
ncbi:MAG: hypothetical protein V5804_13985 [Mucilaginibacter sp.]